MGKRAGLSGLLLVLVFGSGAVAQSPSPEPPPWFGGRVEMPEYGFAVTLPDDWVAFDTTVDVASQLEAAAGFLDMEVWFADGGQLLERNAALGSQGMQLMSLHTTSLDHCLWMALPEMPMGAQGVAEGLYESYFDDPLARDVEPPQRVDLAVGPAYHLRMSDRADPESEWASSSGYVLATTEGVLFVACGTYDDHPDDDWLSIVETIEFLPEQG